MNPSGLHRKAPSVAQRNDIGQWCCVVVCVALAGFGGQVHAQTSTKAGADASAPSRDVGELDVADGSREQLSHPRWKLSADGKEVIDTKAKLAWRRCVEGMILFGRTCTGKPRTFTMAEAQSLVASEGKRTGQRWRLPHIPELKSLLDKGQSGRGAMVDSVWFPATPASWHWSASSSVGPVGNVNPYNYGNVMAGVTPGNVNQLQALEGWGMNFATGEASGGISKRDALFVRLVRPHF
ncbi:MAG: DUF1566 domain-containing protein [Burkholderiaceae bacterium]